MLMSVQQGLISIGTIILYLLVLTLVQMTGFFVFFNYFIQFRKTIKRDRFLIYSIGWMVGILGTAFFLITMYADNELLISYAFILSGIFLALGPLFIGFGIVSYFASFNKKYYFLVSVLFIIVPVILMFLFGRSEAATAINIENILVYFFLLLIGLIHRERVLSYSRISYFLFLVGVSISLLMVITALFWGDLEFFSLLYFGITNWIGVILIIFLIHLEHSISIQETFLLKDKYSHDLANRMQKIVGFLDLAIISKDVNNCQEALQEVVKANDLLLEIRKL
ncbi:MAG: hypothetical protein ACXABI_14960 [Candidatus Hodarchaeales archaeon]|jgi:hypothetical protein